MGGGTQHFAQALLSVRLLVLDDVAKLWAADAAQTAPEHLVGASRPLVDHEVLRKAQVLLRVVAEAVAESLLLDNLV